MLLQETFFDVCIHSEISRQEENFGGKQNDCIMININVIVFFASLKI